MVSLISTNLMKKNPFFIEKMSCLKSTEHTSLITVTNLQILKKMLIYLDIYIP